MLTLLTATALLCLHLSTCLPVDTCSNRTVGKRKGVIRLDLSRSASTNCSWSVRPPPQHVTTLRILDLQLGDCTAGGNLLTLRLGDQNSVELCDPSTAPKLIALRQDRFDIRLETTSGQATAVWLDYWTRPAHQCARYDFQCSDGRRCFNYSQHCDGRFDCDDHSDEVNCGTCLKVAVAAPCADVPFVCFDPQTERCNGVIDCIGGEDEFNCSSSCETAVKCGRHSRCIAKERICDGRIDCEDGMDETNCKTLFCGNKQFSEAYAARCNDYGPFDTLRAIVISVLTIVLALSLIFGTLIYRWYHNRRDIQVLIADMPEFPLPPFEGPGENSEGSTPTERFSLSDFSVGGEIYEAYVQTRRRINSEGRNKKKRKPLHLPMSAPSTKSNSPDLVRNRSEASLVGAPCLSRDQTIDGVVEDFYDDDFPLEIKYVNNYFFDDKSQKGNDDAGKRAAGFKNLFRKKRVWSAGDCDKSRRNECDYDMFTVTNTK